MAPNNYVGRHAGRCIGVAPITLKRIATSFSLAYVLCSNDDVGAPL